MVSSTKKQNNEAASRICELLIRNRVSTPEALALINAGVKEILAQYPMDTEVRDTVMHHGYTEDDQFDSKLFDRRGLLIALDQLISQREAELTIVSDTSIEDSGRSVTSQPSTKRQTLPNNDQLVSLLPELLLSKLLAEVNSNRVFNIVPSNFTMWGCVLLVDISGFTKLSSHYCEQGVDGIDELQRVINSYLGDLVKVIYAYGGDVIKFAGDAILCVFPITFSTDSAILRSRSLSFDSISRAMSSDDGSLAGSTEECVFRATRCAVALTAVKTNDLTVHVALTCGDVNVGIIGGYSGQWEYVVAGPCLLDLSQCLDDAGSQQAVVSKALFNILARSEFKHTFSPELLYSGTYRVSFPKSETDKFLITETPYYGEELSTNLALQSVVNGFVPAPIGKQLTTLASKTLAELREVTTMFMKWEDYDYEEHRNLLKLQDLFVTAQENLSMYGGFLRQFLIDDKGCVLIAIWGTPQSTFIDNAVRAVNAAVYIQQAFATMGMSVSIGITTGKAFCGMVGSDIRQEYAVIGDSVNMAARLMCKANTKIYLDVATVSKLPHGLLSSVTDIGTFQVKGKSVPIPVFSYSGGTGIDSDELNYNLSASIRIRDNVRVAFTTALQFLESPMRFGFFNQNFFKSKRVSPETVSMSTVSLHKYSRLQYLLVEAAHEVFVKTSIAWLQMEAFSRGLNFVSVSLRHEDQLHPYSVWKKIFREVLGRDKFDDQSILLPMVLQMLNSIYSGETEAINRVYLPAIRIAFDITYSSESFRSLKTMQSTSNGRAKCLPSSIIMDVVISIVSHVLHRGSHIIIIENAHFAPQRSLKILYNFHSTKLNALIVLAAVKETIDDGTKGSSNTLSSHLAPALHSSLVHWVRRLFESRPNFKTLFIGDYSFEETRSLIASRVGLESTLNVDNLCELVMTISSGNAFWVEDMIDFIFTSGVDTFMSVIDEGESAPTATAISNSFSMPESPRGNNYSGDFSIKTSHSVENQIHHRKLEAFLLCRFESLAQDDQQLLRIAAVIGMRFNKHMLYGILPRRLKSVMYRSLSRLCSTNWIANTIYDEDHYFFTHPMIAAFLHGLSPATQRRNIHSQCAEYILSYYDDGDDTELIRHLSEFDSHRAFDTSITAINNAYHGFKPNLPELLKFLQMAYANASIPSHFETLHSLVVMISNVYGGSDSQKKASESVRLPTRLDNSVPTEPMVLTVDESWHCFRSPRVKSRPPSPRLSCPPSEPSGFASSILYRAPKQPVEENPVLQLASMRAELDFRVGDFDLRSSKAKMVN